MSATGVGRLLAAMAMASMANCMADGMNGSRHERLVRDGPGVVHFPEGPRTTALTEGTSAILFPMEDYLAGRVEPSLIMDLKSNWRVAIYVPYLSCTDPCEFRTEDGKCAADFNCIPV